MHIKYQMLMLFSAVSKQKDFSTLALRILLQFGICYTAEECTENCTEIRITIQPVCDMSTIGVS